MTKHIQNPIAFFQRQLARLNAPSLPNPARKSTIYFQSPLDDLPGKLRTSFQRYTPPHVIMFPALEEPRDYTEAKALGDQQPQVRAMREVLDKFPEINDKVKSGLLEHMAGLPLPIVGDKFNSSYAFCLSSDGSSANYKNLKADTCFVSVEKGEALEKRVNKMSRTGDSIKFPFPPEAVALETKIHELGHVVLRSVMKDGEKVSDLQNEIFGDKVAGVMMQKFPEYFGGMKLHHTAIFRAMTALQGVPGNDAKFFNPNSIEARYDHATSLALHPRHASNPDAYDVQKVGRLVDNLQIKVADRLLKTDLGKNYLREREKDNEVMKILGEKEYQNAMQRSMKSDMISYAFEKAPDKLASALRDLKPAIKNTMARDFIDQAVEGLDFYRKMPAADKKLALKNDATAAPPH